MRMRIHRKFLGVLLSALLAAPLAFARKPGDPIKPGWNLFSKDQDIQLGLQASNEVKKQYQIVDNKDIQDYVRKIGERLVKSPYADKYPYTFTVVNDKSINAFALPGGPAFIHTGLLAAADNEAQVAGVLAHEISHVALRHGTNQASKANLLQLPAVLAGAATGSNLWGALAGLGAQGVMLRFSRTAETQADLLGTRLMAEAGYNPVEMARFFEKLEAEGGSRSPEFLSDHPNPGNRVKNVEQEITGLPRGNYKTEIVGGFDRFKTYSKQLPPAPKNPQNAPGATGPAKPVPAPSSRLKTLQGKPYVFSYPENWQAQGDGDGVLVGPAEGQSQNGISHGVIANLYQPKQARDLRTSTQEVVQNVVQQNQGMQVVTQPRSLTLEGRNAFMTELRSASPVGGNEKDMLLTVEFGSKVLYMIFIAPENEFRNYDALYNDIVKSIRLSN